MRMWWWMAALLPTLVVACSDNKDCADNKFCYLDDEDDDHTPFCWYCPAEMPCELTEDLTCDDFRAMSCEEHFAEGFEVATRIACAEKCQGSMQGSSGCSGACIGGIIGGCFVPVLVCILWLSGAFEPRCRSPLRPKKGATTPTTA